MLDRPDDALDDVLRLLRPQTAFASRFEAGAHGWALRFGGYEHVKFGVLRQGRCWVLASDEAVELQAGDCYLLSGGTPYVLAAEPGLQPEDGHARYERAVRDGVVRIGDPVEVVLEGGRLTFAPAQADLLLDVLPPVIVVREDSPARAGCAATIALLAAETDAPGAGSGLVREHLAQVLFVQMLRSTAAAGALAPGWLAALADPQVGAALRRIHADPAADWKVADLAAAAHLSRSTFAERFTRLVGRPPLAYAKRWRMHRAAADLRTPGATVGAVARRYGYASHSAFSHAFKDVFGVAPTQSLP